MPSSITCLTVCQPYSSLICLDDADPRAKRCENRGYYVRHRGPLGIHAGKSRSWIDPDELSAPWPGGYGMTMADLTFGAVLGIADVVACLSIDEIRSPHLRPEFAWLKTHSHAAGLYCLVLANVRRLAVPIPAKGAQGPWQWTPPGDLVFADPNIVRPPVYVPPRGLPDVRPGTHRAAPSNPNQLSLF
jgi:hypothetical protein